MQSVLIHPRVLLLAPFYFYHGLFFVFFTSIVPTAFQFTEVSYQRSFPMIFMSNKYLQVLSLNVYIPALIGFAFTVGSVLSECLGSIVVMGANGGPLTFWNPITTTKPVLWRVLDRVNLFQWASSQWNVRRQWITSASHRSRSSMLCCILYVCLDHFRHNKLFESLKFRQFTPSQFALFLNGAPFTQTTTHLWSFNQSMSDFCHIRRKTISMNPSERSQFFSAFTLSYCCMFSLAPRM